MDEETLVGSDDESTLVGSTISRVTVIERRREEPVGLERPETPPPPLENELSDWEDNSSAGVQDRRVVVAPEGSPTAHPVSASSSNESNPDVLVVNSSQTNLADD